MNPIASASAASRPLRAQKGATWLRPILWIVVGLLLAGAAVVVARWAPTAAPSRGAGLEGAPPTVEMVVPPGSERQWARWRGPSGQGLAPGDGYVDRWSATENVRWKVAVPGEGNSSPIVWGDRVYLTSAEGNRRSVLAFDRSDGQLRWRAEAPGGAVESTHPKNGLASSTPTTDGERVYAYFGNQGLMAVDREGRRVWHRDLGGFEPYHGTASSPLLYGDLVLVVQDHQGRSGSFVAAFDRVSGREVWRTPRPTRVGWSSPVAIRVGEEEEIVISGQQLVTAYDPATGHERWRAGGNTFEAIPTPVVGHGLLFVSSGRGGPTLALRPGGRGDVTTSHLAWMSPKGSPFVPSTLLYGDHLYMVNDMTSVATVYQARDGQVVWKGRLGRAQREGFSASPVAFDGRVFFTNDAGQTFVLRAGADPGLLHVNELGEGVLASPALGDGVWYLRGERHLYALGGGRVLEATGTNP